MSSAVGPVVLDAALLEHAQMQVALGARDFGTVFRLMRVHQGASQSDIAAATGLTQARVSRIMADKGSRIVHIDVLERIADGLRIPGAALGLAVRPWELEDDEPLRLGSSGDGDVVLRRGVLRLGAAATIAGVSAATDSEPHAMSSVLSRTNVTDERLAELERMSQRLSVEVVRKNPTAVLPEALSNFRTVRRIIQDSPRTSHRVRLVRTGAQLATVAGESLFVQGMFDNARDWYTTAYHAALDIGDRYAADIALAGQAYLEVYSDDPHGVIHVLSGRLSSCHSHTPAAAWLWAFMGKAHAELGDRSNSRKAFDNSREALQDSPSSTIRPGIFSFVPEKLHFYEAAAYVMLRDPELALTAADSALDLYDLKETTEPALVRFERASALILSGHPDEACRYATSTLMDPRTYPSITVRARAKKFDELLSEHRKTSDMLLWRDVLHDFQPQSRLTTRATRSEVNP